MNENKEKADEYGFLTTEDLAGLTMTSEELAAMTMTDEEFAALFCRGEPKPYELNADSDGAEKTAETPPSAEELKKDFEEISKLQSKAAEHLKTVADPNVTFLRLCLQKQKTALKKAIHTLESYERRDT